MKQNNIILIGMMGAGKTTIGYELKKILPVYDYTDIDSHIEETEGMSISDIFQKYSEQYFRQIEENTINLFAQKQNQIISVGGGAFENKQNRKILSNSGKVFYLYAPINILYDRIKKQTNRPMLLCENPKEQFVNLFNKREINYKKADYIIDTSVKSLKDITEEILRRLNGSINLG